MKRLFDIASLAFAFLFFFIVALSLVFGDLIVSYTNNLVIYILIFIAITSSIAIWFIVSERDRFSFKRIGLDGFSTPTDNRYKIWHLKVVLVSSIYVLLLLYACSWLTILGVNLLDRCVQYFHQNNLIEHATFRPIAMIAIFLGILYVYCAVKVMLKLSKVLLKYARLTMLALHSKSMFYSYQNYLETDMKIKRLNNGVDYDA